MEFTIAKGQVESIAIQRKDILVLGWGQSNILAPLTLHDSKLKEKITWQNAQVQIFHFLSTGMKNCRFSFEQCVNVIHYRVRKWGDLFLN